MQTRIERMMSTRRALALLAALSALPACGDLKNNSVSIDLVSYQSDGSLVLFTPAGIYVYDGLLQTKINQIPIDAVAVPPFVGLFNYCLSADGTVAAVSYTGNSTISTGASAMNTRIGIYQIPGGNLLNTFELPDAAPADTILASTDLALSPDGKLLYAFSYSAGPKAMMVDTHTGVPVWVRDTEWHLPVWSADGATLFALNGTPGVASSFPLVAVDAATAALRWSDDLNDMQAGGLALVGDGTLLTGAAVDLSAGSCTTWPDCPPPIYPLWSATDGTETARIPSAPRTILTGSNPHGWAGFACNATDTCAVRLSAFNPAQSSFVQLYKTDGTMLQRLPLESMVGEPGAASAQGSMAISPDGKFIAIAADPGAPGGVTVFNLEDGSTQGLTIVTQTF